MVFIHFLTKNYSNLNTIYRLSIIPLKNVYKPLPNRKLGRRVPKKLLQARSLREDVARSEQKFGFLNKAIKTIKCFGRGIRAFTAQQSAFCMVELISLQPSGS